MSQSPNQEYLEIHKAFGIDINQQCPIQFVNNSTLAYCIGCNLIVLDANKSNKSQIKSFKCKGHVEQFKIINQSNNKNYILLIDIESQKLITNFYLFDLNLEDDCRLVLIKQKEFQNLIINLLAISYDISLIACYSSLPNSNLLIYSFSKLELESQIKPIDSIKSKYQTIQDLSFFYNDSKRIFTIGLNLIKMYLYTKKGIKLVYNIDSDFSLINHSWVNKNEVICLDRYSRIYVAEPKQNIIRSVFLKENSDSTFNLIKYIISIKRTKGYLLIRSKENCVYYYDCFFNLICKIQSKSSKSEKIENDEFLISICVNSDETQLVSISNKKLIYTYDLNYLFSNLKSDKKIFEFDTLVNNYHSNSVSCISSCTLKSIIATCSSDSLIIWNYDSNFIELKYDDFKDEELFSVVLHPSGLYLILTTSNNLKYMGIYVNSLILIKSISVRSCSNCIFSHGGHLFAFLHGTIIQVYSSIGFEEICSIKTQEMGKIRQLKFSANDNYLFGCSMSGIVRIWNPFTQQVVAEVMTKGLSYIGLALHPNQEWMYLISTEKFVRKLTLPKSDELKNLIKQNGEIKLIDKLDTKVDENITCIEINNSGNLICVGMNKGTIKIFEIYSNQYKSKQYRGHFCSIVRLCFTFNDEYMISSSEDGTIIYWNVNLNLTSNNDNNILINLNSQLNDQILINQNDFSKISSLIKCYETKIHTTKLDTELKLKSKQLLLNNKLRQLKLKFNNLYNEMIKKIEQVDLDEKNANRKSSEIFNMIIEDHLKKYKNLLDEYDMKIRREDEKCVKMKDDISKIEQEKKHNEIKLKNLIEKIEADRSENLKQTLDLIKEKNESVLHHYEIKIEELLNYEYELDDEIEDEIIDLKTQHNKKVFDLNDEHENLLFTLMQLQVEEKLLQKKLNELTNTNSMQIIEHSNE